MLVRCCSTRMRRHLEKAVSAGCVHGTYMAALLKKLTNGCLRSFTVVRQHPFNIPRDDDRARQCPHCRHTLRARLRIGFSLPPDRHAQSIPHRDLGDLTAVTLCYSASASPDWLKRVGQWTFVHLGEGLSEGAYLLQKFARRRVLVTMADRVPVAGQVRLRRPRALIK